MPKNNSRPKTPEICPVCGEDVPPGALACPECGADDKSGWREDAGDYDGAGLTDDEFDYDGFVKKEFGSTPPLRPSGISPLWWVAGVVLTIALALMFLRG